MTYSQQDNISDMLFIILNADGARVRDLFMTLRIRERYVQCV